jgi:hypothetical protein
MSLLVAAQEAQRKRKEKSSKAQQLSILAFAKTTSTPELGVSASQVDQNMQAGYY